MKKNPIIIAYAGANLSSLQFALKRVGYDVSITSSHNKIRNASHIFLPGVGAAASAMGKIKDNFLIDTLVNAKQPTLGICLGMQLLFTSSDEGSAECLDIINGNAQIFEANKNMPVPHMGWNKIKCISESKRLRLIVLVATIVLSIGIDRSSIKPKFTYWKIFNSPCSLSPI